MPLSRLLISAVAVLVLMISPPANYPSADAAEQNFEQIVLSEQQVRSFFTAFPELRKRMEAIEAKYGADFGDDETSGDPLNRLRAYAAIEGAKREMSDALHPYGFSDIDEFKLVGQNIMATYADIMMGDQMPQVNEALKQAFEKIKNDPNIPEVQKKKLLEQFSKMGAVDQRPQALPENKALIERMRPEVEAGMQAMRAPAGN